MIPYVAIGALVLVALAAAPAAASVLTGRKTSMGNPKITLQYARKWGPVFGVTVPELLTIAHIESTHNPQAVNPPEAKQDASPYRGAWGLGQQMLKEAKSKVEIIAKTFGKNPLVRKTLAKWHGDPRVLLDPDFNMMLTAWQVGHALKKFGSFTLAAASYNHGEGGASRMRDEGDVDRDPYVVRALSIQPLYRGVA